jgi:hypothetical protein
MEPKLDNRDYVDEFYANAGHVAPRNPQFLWGFNHLDLGNCEKRSSNFFTLLQGWN